MVEEEPIDGKGRRRERRAAVVGIEEEAGKGVSEGNSVVRRQSPRGTLSQ
jgi:hypothetical protein